MSEEKGPLEASNHNHQDHKDDLFQCLRPLLIFGRLIGIIPFEGIYQKKFSLLKYRRISYAAVKSICFCILMGFYLMVAIVAEVRVAKTYSNDLVWRVTTPIYFFNGVFLYCHFYIHSESLIRIFVEWSQIKLQFAKEDIYLFRDAFLISLFVCTSAILENAILHIDYFAPDYLKDTPALETYYHRSYPNIAKLLPYNEFWSILIFVANKLALYAWNFVEVLIAVMSRAIYFKFKALNEAGESLVLSKESFQSKDKWKSLTHDHNKICDLLTEYEKFLSPLVFNSYAMNTFFLCLQLHLGLTPHEHISLSNSIYISWSFLHLIVRLLLISLSAARINEHAHKICHVLRKCPVENYCIDIERTERRLSTGSIGLTGLNCFVVTKPFILSLGSVIFTLEIVLLQTRTTMTASKCIQSFNNSSY